MGQDAGIDIDAFFWGYADEEVCMLYARLLEGMDAGWGGLIGHHVVFGERTKALFIIVNQDTVLMFS